MIGGGDFYTHHGFSGETTTTTTTIATTTATTTATESDEQQWLLTELPENFEPSNMDCIVGWARQNYHHGTFNKTNKQTSKRKRNVT